jgi:hypothetical protein
MNFYQSVAVGVAAYWGFGILSKGIFEPIQAHLGQELFRLFHRKTEDLDRRVALTRNHIDDLIIGSLRDASAHLNTIINPSDLSDADRRYLQQKVNESYSVSVLTDKALSKFPIPF